MHIGQRIQYERETLNMTQKELADKINISYSVMNRIESRERPVRDEEISKIADVLNVTTDYLLGKSDIKNPYTENKTENEKVNTIAAHLDSKDFSDEDLDDINKFIEFVKTKNNK